MSIGLANEAYAGSRVASRARSASSAGGARRSPSSRTSARRPPGPGGQLASVAHTLDVAGDDARLRIVDEVVAEVGEVEIRLVAGADEVADLDAGRAPNGDDRRAQGAALGDERDGARLHRLVEGLADGRHDGVPEVHAADRVWTADPDAPLVRYPAQLRLPRGAFWADLGVAGRQHERHADLAGLAFLERAHHALHRDRDDEEVDGTRHRSYG